MIKKARGPLCLGGIKGQNKVNMADIDVFSNRSFRRRSQLLNKRALMFKSVGTLFSFPGTVTVDFISRGRLLCSFCLH